MRVRPSTGVGAAIAVGYIALFIGLMKAFGVDMPTAFDSAESTRTVFTVMAITSVVLAVTTSILGWWKPVMRDEHRLGGWFRFVPIILGVAILVAIDYGGLSDLGGELVIWIAATTLLVGFSEEIVYRGLALVGFRGSMGEVGAWFWATLAFGFLHLPNILLGADPGPTIAQIGMAFVAGTALYLARRSTGTILAAMALHAIYDFSAFTGQNGHLLGAMQSLAVVVIFVAFLFTWKHAFDTGTGPGKLADA